MYAHMHAQRPLGVSKLQRTVDRVLLLGLMKYAD